MLEFIRNILFGAATLVGVLWWIYGVPLYGFAPPVSIGLLDMVVLWTIMYCLDLLPRWLTGEKDDP